MKPPFRFPNSQHQKYDISDPATFNREVSSLLSIKDAYPKHLITSTREPEWTYEGIKILDLADFLLG